MHQQPGVARQCGGVAAHVDDAFRRGPALRPCWQRARAFGADARLLDVGKGLGQGKRPFAGWVHQPFVGRSVGHQHFRGHLEQVARYKISSC
ncbi:hypothetical protein D3C71_1487650 [compost metagenome]